MQRETPLIKCMAVLTEKVLNFVYYDAYIFFLQEQFIPIDIHTNKLSDWLLSRRHCKREWQTQILSIREKINNAIQDMPVHGGITKLLSGSCMFLQLNEYSYIHLVG